MIKIIIFALEIGKLPNNSKVSGLLHPRLYS